MKLKKTYSQKTLTVDIEGRLDLSATEKLKDAIMPEINDRLEAIVLNFKNVDMIFSCTLRLLLQIEKTKVSSCKYRIINVNKQVLECFKITGFADILDIETDEDFAEEE